MKHNVFASWQGRVAICAVTFCLAGALCAQTQPQRWKTYSYATDGFSVSFPAVPSENKQSIQTAIGPVELRAYVAEDGNAALYVGVSDYGSATAGRDPDKVLEGAKQGALNNVKAHLLSATKISLGIYAGMKYEAENDSLHFSARMYYVGTTLYQTLIAYPINASYTSTDAFMNSFQLIARTRN